MEEKCGYGREKEVLMGVLRMNEVVGDWAEVGDESPLSALLWKLTHGSSECLHHLTLPCGLMAIWTFDLFPSTKANKSTWLRVPVEVSASVV